MSRARTAVLVGGGAAAAATVAGVATAVSKRRELREAAAENIQRSRRLTKLGLRRAGHYATVRVRGVGADEQRRAALDAQFAIRTAEDVTAELGDMKGAIMKLGQMISFMAPGLPEEVREILATLQADVPPMAPSLAESVVEEELGRHPTRLFADWDPIPVAAASIGQVHRVVLRDGRLAAVKVQYPGVRDAIGADIENVDAFASAFAMMAFNSVDVDALVAELRDRMTDELDYRLEARCQQEFADRYVGHPFIHVPRVHPELSSERVLTSEWVDGVSWQRMMATARDADRQRVAETIFRFCQGAVLRHGVFNGDPHPGNYLFREDGRVTFLDFGLVKRWSEPDLDGLGPVLDGVLARDPERTISAMVSAGFLSAGHGVDPKAIWDYVSRPYEPYLHHSWTFRHEWIGETLAGMLDVYGPSAPVVKVLNMPPSFIVLDRVVWGVSALMGELGATNAFRSILLEYRDGAPPCTELGRLEAAWEAERVS